MEINKCCKCKKEGMVTLGDISLCYKHYDEFMEWLNRENN